MNKDRIKTLSGSNQAFRGIFDTAQNSEAVSDIPESYFLKNYYEKEISLR